MFHVITLLSRRLTLRRSCSQCTNVGFECKTSDKLSRRAFPRGYTESLEERVRSLEQEVRELKALLDEKDEKIDMLSRIRSRTSPSFSSPKRPSDTGTSPTLAPEAGDPCHSDDEESFKVVQSPSLVGDCHPTSFYMGTSSARPLVCESDHQYCAVSTNKCRHVQTQASRGGKVPISCKR
jgi:hypothetical protein